MNTLEKVFDTILAGMPLPDRIDLKKTNEDYLILYHHNLGRTIRNHFKLWDEIKREELLGNMCLPLDMHADEVSQKIIIALWRKLNRK